MKIKQFRKLHNLSQRQLADLLGVNYRTVSRWETGTRTPHESIFKLLERLNKELTN
jgi:transcriptional regulator with XRE-family HTH domain